MATIAKLFRNGRSQAVRLPRELRFEGDRVRVRRAGRGVLVEPIFADVDTWFAELDRLAAEPFPALLHCLSDHRFDACDVVGSNRTRAVGRDAFRNRHAAVAVTPRG